MFSLFNNILILEEDTQSFITLSEMYVFPTVKVIKFLVTVGFCDGIVDAEEIIKVWLYTPSIPCRILYIIIYSSFVFKATSQLI